MNSKLVRAFIVGTITVSVATMTQAQQSAVAAQNSIRESMNTGRTALCAMA